ncbi:MAG: hypothetical protein OQL08_11010 [Gammaproteobacteria bacterium]|nr:hypothetical protein [Gammaproteobacteria bacterium]
MNAPRFATPLRLHVGGSRRLRWVVAAFLSISLLALLALPLAWSVKLPMALFLSALFFAAWRKRAELGGVPVELVLLGDGGWRLQRGGESLPLQLLGQSTVSHSLLLLCFAGPPGQGGFDCLLWQAELPPLLWRRLRLYLRLYAAQSPLSWSESFPG